MFIEHLINISGIADAVALGQGTIKATSLVKGVEIKLTLNEVRYIPTIVHKIISENLLEGCIIENRHKQRMIAKYVRLNGRKIIEAKRSFRST